MIEVHGSVEPGFENARAEFAAFLAEQTADPGAQLAAYADGRLVVDLVGGDELTGDTLTGVFSITKGATHIVVAQLVQEGVLALDKPVATLPFPLTLRELLGHRSGLGGDDLHLGLPADQEPRYRPVLHATEAGPAPDRHAHPGHSLGTDLVMGESDHFALGFETVAHKFGFLGERAFGHGGAAGSMGWADPDTGVAYGYVRRRMGYPGPENQRLGAAVIRARELLLP
jgi:CubicO group peptidase (beta-lactamase class C family)